jgi:hypothetical protein
MCCGTSLNITYLFLDYVCLHTSDDGPCEKHIVR